MNRTALRAASRHLQSTNRTPVVTRGLGLGLPAQVSARLCDGVQLGRPPRSIGTVHARGAGGPGYSTAVLSGAVTASSAWYVLDLLVVVGRIWQGIEW